MNCATHLMVTLMLLVAGGLGQAASEPVYDEEADARKQIELALAPAAQSGSPARNIVLVFGANWCRDCRALDAQMHKPGLASLLAKSFVVVKIDVGRFDKNVDLAQQYGVPINKGIPALAVLDPRGRLLYAQDQGQFSSARRMNLESFKAFFEQWKPKE